jgi:hypothetical protein
MNDAICIHPALGGAASTLFRINDAYRRTDERT